MIAAVTGMVALLACIPMLQTRESANAKPVPQGTPTFTPDASVHWNKMSKAQHIDYMKKVVIPKMKAAFGTFDAKKFGRFNCMTCHGKGAKDTSFKMPNPRPSETAPRPRGF